MCVSHVLLALVLCHISTVAF